MKVDKLLIVLCPFAAGALLTLLYATVFSQWAPIVNSDAMYLPALYRDLFLEGGDIGEWFLTPSPYFFPDMPLYFLSRFVAGNLYDAIYLYMVFQVFLTFLCVTWIYKKVLADTWGGVAVANACVFIPVSMLGVFFWGPFKNILLSAHHFSALLVGLGILALCAEHVRGTGRVYVQLTVIVLLSFVMTVSDMVFTVWISIPIAGSAVLLWLCGWLSAGRTWMLVAGLGGSSIIAAVIGRLLSRVDVQGLYLCMSFDNLMTITTKNLWKLHDLVLYKTWIVVVAVLCLYSIWWIRRNWRGKGTFPKDPYLSFLICVTVICIILSALIFSTAGMRTTRYYIAPAILPIIFAPLLLVDDPRRRKALTGRWGLVAITLCCLSVMGGGAILNAGKPMPGTFPSPITMCVDELAGKLGVERGLATYWQAKHTSMLSGKSVRVVQVSALLKPYYWITSDAWYDEPFDFIIVHNEAEPGYKIDTQRMKAIYGEPALVEECGDSTIYVYEKSSLIVESRPPDK
jgi:hypothetical protein